MMNQDTGPAAVAMPTDRLQIPARLYGRAQALSQLTSVFDRACQGRGSVFLVPGNSGSGKTSLVREIRGEVQRRNGLFLEGKFNQYHQNVPYFAIRGILGAFCRELAGDDRASREAWETRLRAAVGGLGQLLLDLAPELEPLLGPQLPVPEISPLEARHRLAGVLGEFLQVLCRPEHPVLLFLDDMQWVDAASAEVLTRLQVGSTLRYLLVVATYRDEEVDASHPLVQIVAEFRRQAVPVDELTVANLTEGEVRELLADTLQPATDQLESLAMLLHRRTAGNPFFTRTLLASLYEQGLLRFDRPRGTWCWTSGEAGGHWLPASIVKLFAEKIQHWAPETVDLLSLAACLGSQFELPLLAMVSQRSAEECRRLLQPALDDGLLLPLNRGPAPLEYRFLHDRVQQAAYDLIPPADRPRFRLRVGRLLWARLSDEQLGDRLFQVVDHLNAGLALIDDARERVEMVRLNTRAARKARAATAYHAALLFHRAVAGYLDQPEFATHLWTEHHDLALQFFLDRAESEFLEGDRQLAEQSVRLAVAHAVSAIEKAEALNTLIVQFTLLARYPEAIAAGREGLAALGIVLPEADYEAARDVEVAAVRAALQGRTVAELADLPVMTHPEMRTAATLLITMGPPCYRSHQRLWSVLVPKVVNLTIRFGNLPQVGYSHTAFGGLVGWVANDYALTKEFGELATRLMTEQFDSPSDRSVFYLMIGSSVRHWCAPLRASSEDYEQAYEIGLASGNLQYAAYAFGHNMYCRLYQGTPLPELIQESEHSLAFSRTRLNQWAIDLLAGGLKILAGFRSGGVGPDEDPDWEGEYLRQVAAHHNIQVECIYKVNRALALLLLGQCERALEWSDQAERLIYTVGTQGLLPWPEHVFIRALLRVRLLPNARPEQQVAWRDELDYLVHRLEVWARACPENFAHKLAFVAAETAVLEGRWTDALRQYREAADAAAKAGFVHWEGLTHERVAEFLEARGQGRLAQSYWQDACRCYDQWGATAKLSRLEAAYGERLGLDVPGEQAGNIPEGTGDSQFRQELRGEHRRQLRIKAAWTRQAQLEGEVHRQAEELAEALDRLRREVAERKWVEQTLAELNADLEQRVQKRTAEALALYHNAPCGYHGLARDGLVLQINDTELNWLGYSREEVVGRMRLADLMTPAEAARFEAQFPTLIESGQPWTAEWDLLHKDGSPVAFLVNGEAVWDAAGGFVQSRGTVINITERKRAEAQLRKLQSVVEQSAIVVLITDTAGTIEYVNRQFEEQTGYAAAEVLGGQPNILKSGVQSPEFYEALWQTLRRGEIWRGELCNRRKNGSLFWELAVIAPLRNPAGQTTHYVAVKEDITERRAMSDELRTAKEAAEAANRAKTTFLANMSHEIRTPMNAILGFSQLLLRDPNLSSTQREYLETIGRSGDHLMAIINDILELARIESGREVLKPANFDLRLLLDDVERTYRMRTQGGRLGFRIERLGELPSRVWGDETKLRQVIFNLLGNAVKFTPSGGEVALRVRADAEPHGRLRLHIAVDDSGAGIAPDDLRQLFQPYFQTRTGQQLSGGTGLGLCISRGLVRLMGGELTATSRVGQGSTFQFDVQLDPAQGGGQAPAAPPPQVRHLRPGSTCRVLVADDQAENRDLLRSVLTPLGFQVCLAQDGAEAVAQCRAWTPHVILLDLRMPGIDGFEAARQIRAAHGSTVKIIALSAGVLPEQQQEALAAGVDAFLAKPFRAHELLAEIQRWTGVEYVVGSDAPPAGEHLVLASAAGGGPDRPAVAPPAGPPPVRAAETPVSPDLSRLPQPLAEQLREAARTANYRQLLGLIDQTRALDADLASRLDGLVKRFDYAAVQTFLTKSAPSPNAAPDASPAARVLVAEDAPDIQRLMRAILIGAGAAVDVADDGQQAYRLARASQAAGRPYDLILMDVQMPVLDGLAAAQLLRHEGWQGPIVALTGQAQPEDRQRCLDAGCSEYLAKPVSRRDLLQVLSRYVAPRG